VAVGGRYADIFQFTGLTHGPGGVPQPGGFDEAAVLTRAQWLEEAAGDRLDAIERSALVQSTVVGEGADAAVAEASASLGLTADEVAGSPFVLLGSVDQLVDELERRRERLGISHIVVRDAEGFAPVVAALRGR
jgi:hypothetical protein